MMRRVASLQSHRDAEILRAAVIPVFLLVAAAAQGATLHYWIEPCPADAACRPGDPELARWAFEAWQAAAGGKLELTEVASREKAQIRVIFGADGRAGLYGEARPIVVDGMQGAEVYVLTPAAANSDPLLRDAIVYLTCVHETGHALGLPHTAQFADIMYSFQYGGDIEEYFGRYRRQLRTRADIRKHAGLSDDDRRAIRNR
jgi:hypothetical protein